MRPTMENEQRVLQVEGAYNVRDLGGYATKDGKSTSWGAFYRADGLHRLTDESREQLVDKGVAKVIDLRHATELAAKKNVFADYSKVDYHHVSLVNPTSLATRQTRSLGDLYVGMLEGSQEELLRVFTLLADPNGQAALYHCAAGKDRTGVVSALLLNLAGVPNETIIEDYTLTAQCLAPIMHEFRSERPEFIGCDPSNMVQMLNHLEQNYENAERYLLSIGLTAEQVEALKSRLIEDRL